MDIQWITRCVTHHGPTINLVSTIDIYDKLVIGSGIFLNIYFNAHHVVVKKRNHELLIFFFLHNIAYEEPKRDLTLNDDMF
jgi:hypothetical protein